jgi:hypothetical protein
MGHPAHFATRAVLSESAVAHRHPQLCEPARAARGPGGGGTRARVRERSFGTPQAVMVLYVGGDLSRKRIDWQAVWPDGAGAPPAPIVRWKPAAIRVHDRRQRARQRSPRVCRPRRRDAAQGRAARRLAGRRGRRAPRRVSPGNVERRSRRRRSVNDGSGDDYGSGSSAETASHSRGTSSPPL